MTDDAGTSSDQNTRDLHQVVDQLRQQLDVLATLESAYRVRPDVQRTYAYLGAWFTDTRAMLSSWIPTLERGLADPAWRRSPEFDHTLALFLSLGYGFDVDLAWSGRDRDIRVRNGEMTKATQRLRVHLRVAA